MTRDNRLTLPLVPLAGLDLQDFLALNNEHEVELSALDAAEFARLVSIAVYAHGTRDCTGFLLAFDHAAAYASPNFIWFKERFQHFVYIDRVVVAASQRGQGLASRLYADLVEVARARGHNRLVAEVNSDPPNPASDAFHAACGFVPIGSARLNDRGKTVTYLCRML